MKATGGLLGYPLTRSVCVLKLGETETWWMVDTQPQPTPPLTNTTSGNNKYLTCLE